MERIIESKIPPLPEPAALIDYLAGRFTYHSSSVWREKIASGMVEVNGEKVPPEFMLRGGEIVRYLPPPLEEPEVDVNYRVVHEDDSMLVIDKPPNLPAHPSGRYFKNTLWHLLKTRYGEVHPVNRLDRETAGLTLWAKNPGDAAKVRIVLKRYFVLVEGIFPANMDAEGFLFHDEASLIRKKRKFSFQPSPSLSSEHCRTELNLEKIAGNLSLVSAILHTGRTHQIRATLSSLGFPVVGDKLYGVDERMFLRQLNGSLDDADRARLRLASQALFSAETVFIHPVDKAPKKFALALPPEWDFLLKNTCKNTKIS